MIPESYALDIPPAFVGQSPMLYVVAIFSLIMVTLLAAEWLWRTGWSMIEKPAPTNHPLTAFRILFILLMSATLIRVGPDVILFAGWHDMTPAHRWEVAVLDKELDIVALFPFSVAWLISLLGSPMVVYQLERQPVPVHLWPTARQLARPLKIGVGVLAISAALVFAR